MATKRYKKAKPLGICTVCRAFTDEHIRMNHRCIKSFAGRRCSGTYRSSLTVVWHECPTCHAMGQVGSQKCGEMRGLGLDTAQHDVSVG